MKVFELNYRAIPVLFVVFLLVFGFGTGRVHAQDGWGTGGWGDSGSDPWADETEDSTAGDTAASGWGDDSGFEMEEEKEEETVVKPPPYERFVPPYDTVYELVTYEGVVEVMGQDIDGSTYELEIDTIMFRTNQWLEEEFGKKTLKEFMQSNAVNPNASELEYKIILKGNFPLIVKPNDFAEYQNGHIQFTMEIRIREGRYRYKITDLVHIAPVRANEKEGIATYFEYLMKTENDVRGGDVILISADRKINEMVAALAKKCRTNPIFEEDDW